ncbi:MAG TPA: hypothetical protein DDW81_11115, partial [Cryomorphaceae bacterium]|nr:hypothetical protein [Cryomorphaceae bacterium]
MRKKPDEVAYILTNAAQNFKGIRNTNLKHHLYFKLAYLNIIRGNIESATQYADSVSLMCQADPACRA